MYVVLVQFRVKPEFAESFKTLVKAQAANSLKHEAGCKQFDVSFDPGDPTRCLLYEVYDDEAAFGVHCAADYFARFGEAIADGVVSKDLSTWERSPTA